MTNAESIRTMATASAANTSGSNQFTERMFEQTGWMLQYKL